MENVITVLVVEHPLAVRRTLCARLLVEPDIALVGEADNLDAAVMQAQALRPRVILLDAEMAGLDVTRALNQLAARCPASTVVILSLDGAALKRRLGSGVAAVVSKMGGAAALLQAIRTAAPARAD